MKRPKRRSDRSGRKPLPSPGRPPASGRVERTLFWTAIAAGSSSEDAAALAGVAQAVGTRWFRKAGGMAPTIYRPSAKPAVRPVFVASRARGDIAYAGFRCSMHAIARGIGRAASTISRELRRNAATRGGDLQYRAIHCTMACGAVGASAEAREAGRSTRRCATYVQGASRRARRDARRGRPREVRPFTWNGRRHGRRQERRWARAWSPEQIARRLPIDFPDDPTMRISHEAIYQALFIQGRGALRRELTACLRSGRALRVPRARTRGRGKGFVAPEIMISERPAEAYRPGRARPLGRRLDPRPQPFGNRHAGRAHHALYPAAASAAHARLR